MTEIDTTKPNAARIYDYMLGGDHNFEVDRQAAEQMRKLFPSMQNIMRVNRWFLHTAVARLVEAQFTCFLDLASGLPTEGYVHDLAPSAKVVYNDRDPITVAYANQILEDNAQVKYLGFDLTTDFDHVLAEANTFFNNQRLVAVSFVGIAYFLTDAQVITILATLHRWCAEGSQIAISWGVGNAQDSNIKAILESYTKMGSPLYVRSLEDVRTLLADWTILDPGLQPLSDWVDSGSWEVPGSGDSVGADMYGCIITK